MTDRDQHISPMPGQVMQTVAQIDSYDARTGRFDTDDLDKAQVISSQVLNDVHGGLPSGDAPGAVHKLIIDVDLPAQLIPSSTPGHFHLYIDHPMTWKHYVDVLAALERAGIIEPGYLGASIDRGYTAVRLPWVKKAAPVETVTP